MEGVINVAVMYMENIRFQIRIHYLKVCKSVQTNLDFKGEELECKKMSPILKIGLLIFVAQITISRFIIPIPDWIGIPILVLAIVLIMMGGLKVRKW